MEKSTTKPDLLLTGMSSNANLLSDDELGELFGGYTHCPSGYCAKEYENQGLKCMKKYCTSNYVS